MISSLLFDLRSFMLQRHIGPSVNVVHSRVAGKGWNLGRSPARGFLAMFMDEVLLHLHLQLVSLHKCSDLWLSFLCLQRADFFKFHTCAQQRRAVINHLMGFSQEGRAVLGCNRRSSVLSSSRLRPYIVPLALAAVKASPLRTLHGVPTSLHATRTLAD